MLREVTRRPWSVGTRFTKRSYKSGVLRTYVVAQVTDLGLVCVADHGGQVTFGARELDRYEMQGAVVRL